MKKTITLTIVSIKEFVRNWRSIILLLILPLLLIGSFFISFSAEGLQELPVGVITNSNIELNEIKSRLSEVLVTKEFNNLDECLFELKQYKQYACIEIIRNINFGYDLNLHYDNTKPLVIWGVVNHIKTTVDYIKKEKTKEIATKVLEQAEDAPTYINIIESELNSLDRNFDDYSSKLDSSIYNMNNLKLNQQSYYSSSVDNLNTLDQYANYLVSSGVQPYSQYGYEIKAKSSLLRNNLNTQNNDINSLNSGNLADVKDSLRNNENLLNEMRSNINSLRYYINEINKIDPEAIADPIQLKFNPTYLPEINPETLEKYKTNGSSIDTLIKGETLLTFQVIFPKILLLIVMFISLLTSSFICLSYLESPAINRINTIKKMFVPSFLAVFISSFLIIIIPIICVIILGNYLFLLPFFKKILIVLLLIFISISIYVLIGMGLSYLIKKKSLTLIVSVFLLIFLLFFSGFILPIERMGRIPAKIALNFPGNIASDALNKSVFYDQPLSSLNSAILILGLILILILMVVLVIKYFRDKKID